MMNIIQMRAVSLELEILGRHQHPDLTIPFLKVISENSFMAFCIRTLM